MTETLAYGYSSENTQRELSNEYQHAKIYIVFMKLCIVVIWRKVERLKNAGPISSYGTSLACLCCVCVPPHKGAGLFCELFYLQCTLVFGDMRQKKDYQDTMTLFCVVNQGLSQYFRNWVPKIGNCKILGRPDF